MLGVQPSLQDRLLLTARLVGRQGAMVQCRRALKPDGLFLSAMWGGSTLQVRGLVVCQALYPLAPRMGRIRGKAHNVP